MVRQLIRYFLYAGSIVYFILLLYLTFFAGRRRGEHNYREKVNFAFLSKIFQVPELNHQQTMAVVVEVLGNIAAFIPFPAALCIILKRRFSNKQILFVVFFSTFIIECLQFIFNLGIFDIDDIFLNFLGGAAGIVLFDLLYKQLGYENFDIRH